MEKKLHSVAILSPYHRQDYDADLIIITVYLLHNNAESLATLKPWLSYQLIIPTYRTTISIM
jgi:hypothetical protein